MVTAAQTPCLCYNCFARLESPDGPCPYCGFDLEENRQKFPVALRAGTVLNGRYVVGRVLGQGGFGITYLAFDTQLQAKVAVKEYMPGEMATRVEGAAVSVMADTRADDFLYGAERFQEEARTLAKFIGHPNIAGVSSYFDENDTSYFVMDYIEGVSFKNYIANNGGKVSVDETLNVMIPVLRALTAVHGEGFIHRDVTPDNIYISKDGNVKLLDFGSARYSIGDKSKSLDVILKVGYAPKEQYIRRGRQGPYTDVYSCAACFYAALTGFLPPESLERLDQDDLVPVSQAGVEIPEWLDKAILKGLAVQPEDRFQSAAEFLEAIESRTVVDVPAGGAPGKAPARKRNPLLIGLGAAALAALLAISLLGNGRRPAGNGMENGGYQGERLLKAEVPSVTIRGREYSTDLFQLDLSNQGLTDGDIQDLKYMINLRSLQLNGNQISDLSPLSELPRLENLQLQQNSLSDITPLAGMTELRYIGLSENPELSDLSPLTGMTEMQNLDIYGLPVMDYGFLNGMTKLSNLQILLSPELGEPDFSALSTLTGLEQLHMYTEGNGNSADALPSLDLGFLSGMTNLKRFQMNGMAESFEIPLLENLPSLTEFRLNAYNDYYLGEFSLEPFRNLTSLQTLELTVRGHMEPLDLEPLSGMTNLRTLQLQCGDVENLAPVRGLSKLESLQIYHYGQSGTYSSLTDLSGLAGMTGLKSLNLTLGGARDLTPISKLTNLTELYLSGAYSAEDLSFLKGLTKLKTLNLSNSGQGLRLASLEGLEDAVQLQSVQINCEGLASLKGLENLKNLRELSLYGGKAAFPDTEPLRNLTNLTTLRLPNREYDTPAFDAGGLAGLGKVQELEINGKITSFEPIARMTGLKTFRYYGSYEYNEAGISLEPLASMTGLTELYLNCTVPGCDISPLGRMTNLRSLTLYINSPGYRVKVGSLEPLANLKKLTALQIGNTVDNIDTAPVSFVADLNVY